ncbi:ergothioneine biosynthesis protein EgtB [Archangium gephyra]|uniref:ergothioneine biosynthesis protein EgtB n=1 Tax=Archangium gephyra TaxID=48 RepID=UPI003B77418E
MTTKMGITGKQVGVTDATREFLVRWGAVRRQTEALAAPLTPEDQQVQSMPDASPTKWHLAHTTWFFEAFVLARLPGHHPFRPEYAFLFNSYYEAVGPRVARAARGMLSRPGLEEVRAYRAHVDAALARQLEAGALDADALALVELGLQHEQQHQELLLTDAKHALAQNPLRPAYREAPAATAAPHAPPPLRWTRFDEGLVHVGHAGTGFSFDNERPRHRVFVPGFELGSRLVTCGEWLEFMRDGGYARAELWLSDGWAAVQAHGWRAPLYWEEREGAWWHFTLHGLRPVDLAAPVCHVSHYEADAFARWAGARLPTEAEWEVAAAGRSVTGNLLEAGTLAPRAAPAGDLAQLFGDCWEWTQSAYLPYPGFRSEPGAVGEYNGKFMSGQCVLRGGSAFTPQSHVRASYRNFFPPAARWQVSGLRLAREA